MAEPEKIIDPDDPIENAIAECDQYIDAQQASAHRLLRILVQIGVVSLMLLSAFVFLIFYPQRYTGYSLAREIEYAIQSATEKASEDGKNLPPITVNPSEAEAGNPNTIIVFGVMSLFTVIFGVLMSVYRFHLNEISKTEHYKMGFMRIRIAAESGRKGYQSEVREALTHLAFSVPGKTTLTGKQAVESPVPGHPVSDLSMSILNKFLDSVDIKIAEKPGTAAEKAG